MCVHIKMDLASQARTNTHTLTRVIVESHCGFMSEDVLHEVDLVSGPLTAQVSSCDD